MPRAETTMCDFSDYVASYDEAIDVVRQYEDATNSKFLVIKRQTYASGIVKIINRPIPFTLYNRLSNRLYNRFDNRLYRVYKHSTGLTTGCIV